MKKTAIIVSLTILVGIVSFVGTSYWIGREAKIRYMDVVTRIIDSDPLSGAMKVVDTHWDSGWFRSKSVQKVRVTTEGFDDLHAESPDRNGDREGASRVFELVHTIHHGPFPLVSPYALALAAVETELRIPPDKWPDFREAFGDILLLTAGTTIDFDDNSHSQITVPSLSYMGPDLPVDLAWQGLEGTITLSPGTQVYSGHLSSGEWRIDDKEDEFSATLGDITISWQMRYAASGAMLGSIEMSLGVLDINVEEEFFRI
uniref:Uncharacterized protein n=1 Tax=Candidatus Kentrum eta TaxID=2126337 RepID=A0A450UP25_9GAMM|nr:MAG: protein of unknown function (DUF945) [Candidatus Kentron sp. H]VFJ94302.1 MAG: protein of unknown function (DUF945) [Candidatus Kentron sp. H]VFK00920.1 MAG: protein of unknown function (DUF945) [Candidatus Kentron sp. H]